MKFIKPLLLLGLVAIVIRIALLMFYPDNTPGNGGESIEKARSIEAGELLLGKFERAGKGQYYSFTPTSSGTHSLVTQAKIDLTFVLYDADKTFLGKGTSTIVEYNFQEGKTYNILIMAANPTTSASSLFGFQIVRPGDEIPEQYDKYYHTADGFLFIFRFLFQYVFFAVMSLNIIFVGFPWVLKMLRKYYYGN